MNLIFCIENLALGRPTWEQFPWIKPKKNWGSKNAVDGSYNDRGASGNQCTISDNYRKTAEWRVDLGDIVSISPLIFTTGQITSKVNLKFECSLPMGFLYVVLLVIRKDIIM